MRCQSLSVSRVHEYALFNAERALCICVPNGTEFRKPFVPPTSKTPVLIRTISYGGEPHPADRKAAIVVPVSKLPLKDAPAVHKFKLLAGVRWTIDPPKDSGISETEKDLLSEGSGYFKISCEDFPEAQQNVKWCSDTLDKILKEANVSFGLAFHLNIVLNPPMFGYRTEMIPLRTFPKIFDTCTLARRSRV